MPRVLSKAAVVALVALFLLSAGARGYAAGSGAPTYYISLTPLPPDLPTSSNGTSAFPALAVSVKDVHGNPVILPNDTEVYLSSSSPILGVQPTVTIPAGEQYAIAEVTTTETPGQATVTAVAPGFQSASTSLTTSLPRGFPTQLEAFPLPDELMAGTPASANVTVEVLDAAGLPARTIQSTPVQLTSSNTSILVATGTTIAANQTLGFGSVSVNGEQSGVAYVTASASGFVSSTATVTVASAPHPPNTLQVTVPQDLPADGRTYDVLTVSLTYNGTSPAVSQTGTSVLLTSSAPSLVSIDATGPVLIPAGQTFVTVPISTSASAGSAFITASSPNFVSSTVEVTTVSIPPTKLGVYLSDSNALFSTTADKLSLVVQLQDSGGIPADARVSESVIVSFSNTTLSKALVTLTVPKGSDLAYTTVPLNGATSGTFTAISNGLYAASAQFSATLLGVTYSLGPNHQTIYPNQTDTVYYSLQYQGIPLPGASLAWSAKGGTVSPATSSTGPDGSASATFTPTGPGIAEVTVTAEDPVVGSVNATAQIFVIASPQPKAPPSILTRIISDKLYLGAIVGGVLAAVLGSVFLLRRRRGETVEDDGSFDMGGASGEGTAFGLSGASRRGAW